MESQEEEPKKISKYVNTMILNHQKLIQKGEKWCVVTRQSRQTKIHSDLAIALVCSVM